MLPINCPLERHQYKNYLRCVNRETLEYVDIPVARGLNVKESLWPLVLNADRLSGNYKDLFPDKEAINYDYAYFISLEKETLKNVYSGVGFYVKNKKLFRLRIDLETNKILEEEIEEEYK